MSYILNFTPDFTSCFSGVSCCSCAIGRYLLYRLSFLSTTTLRSNRQEYPAVNCGKIGFKLGKFCFFVPSTRKDLLKYR